MEIKDTLLMPKTDFQMKANLKEKEKAHFQNWKKNKLYEKILNFRKASTPFILHNGPPYANGNIHVGHALNMILKDIIVRQKTLEGFYAPFKAGWDTHGLPIENKMLEELGKSKDELDFVELRQKASQYALEQIKSQRKQFLSLQLFADLNDFYVTMDKSYEKQQLKLFKKMALNGLIYKGLKPIYWSPSSQSALAEAEVEYAEHRSPEVIVAFDVSKGNGAILPGDQILIMTTTPWTLIANSAVAIGEDIDYALIKTGNKRYIVANVLVKQVAEKAKLEQYQIVDTFKGKNLISLEYVRPMSKDKFAPIVVGHHVSTEAGTGLVHIAPLFGEDDYLIGKKYHLDMVMHVDAKGMLTKEAGKYEGLFYEMANKNIGMDLESKGKLLSLKFIKHSYPMDWRTHKPVIYRGVPQWFVNIEKISGQIQTELENVVSYPSWGKERLAKMIGQRKEWTISRQRTWGVPLIIFYDKSDSPVIDEKIFDHVISLVGEHGSNIWWEKSADQLLPEEFQGKGFSKEMDIMDVWFDSGSSSIAVQVEGNRAPFDLYLEGSDQYRGWFNSSLINGVAYTGHSPYKSFISHGFVLDGKQQKMSKSKGNVVDPLKLIEQHRAEVLRLWVANSEYTSDVTISPEIIKQNVEIYRRIRNTIRYMLGNLDEYKDKKVKLEGIHKYISDVTNNFALSFQKNYNKYNFIEIVKEINKFFIDLSGWYFSYAKDSLYCDLKDAHIRKMIRKNIFDILKVSLYALAPILPTTIEEAYQLIPGIEPRESIFLENWNKSRVYKEPEEKFKNFMIKTRPMVNGMIEASIKNGEIKRSNQAIVTLKKSDMIASKEEMAKYLLVAKVEEAVDYSQRSFESEKCIRCWNHFYPQELKNNLCLRCQEVIRYNN